MQIIRLFLIRPYLYILIVLTGISLKFYHLDYKLFWFDEVCTIQHTSGIPGSAYPARVSVNEIKHITFYKDVYHLNKQDYKIGPQLKGLLTSTQLNPLHYPFLMFWYRIVGDSPFCFRLFSVFIFILTLPFMFLLSRKLFDSTLAGWIAVSLFAVSPHIHLFAQEARYYMLWSFILIVLHYSLLHVIQHNTFKGWSIYTSAAALALYASPLSIIIIFGHSVFVILNQKNLIPKYSISMVVVFFAYLPWALSLFFRLDEITHALAWQSNSVMFNVAFWLPFLGQCFYMISIFSAKLDFFAAFNQASFTPPPGALSAFIFNTIVLIIVSIAFIYLFRKTHRKIKYFLLLIIIPGFVFFYINDLVRDAMLSWWWRYLIFIAPGIILLMTNFLYERIEKGKLFYFVCYLALAFIGISSIGSIANSRHWFMGNKMNEYIDSARLISEAESPLLITDYSNNSNRMIDFMVVLLECHSDEVDILRAAPDSETIENKINQKAYSDIYVLYASDELTKNLKSQFGSKMEKLDGEENSSIWKIIINKQ